MVDNFEQIRSLLKFENDGDCYYVQLLRRQSDDPHTNGKADPRYHGNMHSRSVKDYLIPSLEYFDKVKEDIITICKTFNVRAYIRLNKRTFKNIALEMLKHIAEQCASGGTFNSPYHLVASAAGEVCSAGKDKTWIVDLDEEYLPHQEKILKMMFECEPYIRNIAELAKVFFNSSHTGSEQSIFLAYKQIKDATPIVPTKHGKHIIAKPFNVQTFGEKWKQYCQDNGVTLPLPKMFNDPDNKYTVFELTDVYLPISKEFEQFLPEHDTFQKDKNKISFRMAKLSDRDVHMLEFYWKGHCLKNKYWMKQCDIHKDNPSVLYCP